MCAALSCLPGLEPLLEQFSSRLVRHCINSDMDRACVLLLHEGYMWNLAWPAVCC